MFQIRKRATAGNAGSAGVESRMRLTISGDDVHVELELAVRCWFVREIKGCPC